MTSQPASLLENSNRFHACKETKSHICKPTASHYADPTISFLKFHSFILVPCWEIKMKKRDALSWERCAYSIRYSWLKADEYKATQTQWIAPWISCESNES